MIALMLLLWLAAPASGSDLLWRSRFRLRGIPYPPAGILLEVVKSPASVTIWAADRTGRYDSVWQYPVCAMSGGPGPKRRQGDDQVPEGVYRVDRFNARGRFGPSFGINYPNASDRVLSDREHPGGDIYFHGKCCSIGCVSFTDQDAAELYFLVDKMYRRARRTIPVLIFPWPMTAIVMAQLRLFTPDKELLAFWENLASVYEAWRSRRMLPAIRVDSAGGYVLNSS